MINSDFESAGDGSLTVVTTKAVNSNNSDITLTAWDIDLAGTLTTGSKTPSIHGAKVAQTLGLGGTAKHMHVSDVELQRMTSTGGFVLGSVSQCGLGPGKGVRFLRIPVTFSQKCLAEHATAALVLAALRHRV